MCAPRLSRHTSIRYSSSCHTRVNMGASIFFTAAMILAFRHGKDTDNCKNFNIVSMCAVTLVHTSNISSLSKNLFSFPVAVNNSIKVGHLVLLLSIFVITENIMKRPVYLLYLRTQFGHRLSPSFFSTTKSFRKFLYINRKFLEKSNHFLRLAVRYLQTQRNKTHTSK
jgi:hypothetical protein